MLTVAFAATYATMNSALTESHRGATWQTMIRCVNRTGYSNTPCTYASTAKTLPAGTKRGQNSGKIAKRICEGMKVTELSETEIRLAEVQCLRKEVDRLAQNNDLNADQRIGVCRALKVLDARAAEYGRGGDK